MASTTSFYGLQKLDRSEPLSTNDYAFVSRNMDVIDRLLYKIHNAVFEDDTPIADPTDPLTLELETSGGGIPAGRTVRYKFTWVDAYGNESAASPEATISTPAPITRPNQPSLSSTSSGGTLLSGPHFYILSAYVGTNTNETNGSVAGTISVRSGSTNVITLTFPTLPSGADGFNIYRRRPGEVQFYYIDSVDMNVAIPPTTYEDDGSIAVSGTRTPSATNLTYSSNKIVVTVPGATPSVPDGYTWKLYRTFVNGDYNSSLLEWVTTETSFGSGIITPETEDLGGVTTIGSPPSVSAITGDVDRIDALVTAVDAIEATLGTNPEGSFDDVADRLDDIDSRLGASTTIVYGWEDAFSFDFNQATVPDVLDVFDSLSSTTTDPYVDTDGSFYGVYFPIDPGNTDTVYVAKSGSWGNGEAVAIEGDFTFENQGEPQVFVMGLYDTVNDYKYEVAVNKKDTDPYNGYEFRVVVEGESGTEYIDTLGSMAEGFYGDYFTLRLEVLTAASTSLDTDYNVRLVVVDGDETYIVARGLYTSSAITFNSARYGAIAFGAATDGTDIAVFSGKVQTKPTCTQEDVAEPVTLALSSMQKIRNPLYQYLPTTYTVLYNDETNLDGVMQQAMSLPDYRSADGYMVDAYIIYEAGVGEDIIIELTAETNEATPVDPFSKSYTIVPDDLTTQAPGYVYTGTTFVLEGTGSTRAVHLKGMFFKDDFDYPGSIILKFAVDTLVATPTGATLKRGTWIQFAEID